MINLSKRILSLILLIVFVSGCSAPASNKPETTGNESISPEKTIKVSYPAIAPITLPDLSVMDSGGDVFSNELSSMGNAYGTGLDIVSPNCDANGNPIDTDLDVFKLTEVESYLSTDGEANVQLTTDPDGTKHYRDLGGNNNLTLLVKPDGSGEIVDLGDNRNLKIIVNKDGVGELTDLGEDNNLNITVNADGSGQLSDLGGDRNIRIDVASDGTGNLTDLGGDRNLQIAINANGTVQMRNLGGNNNINIEAQSDGSGSYKDLGGDNNVTFIRKPNGEISMTDLGGDKNITLNVASNGSGSYRDMSTGVNFKFGADSRASDGSGYVIQLPEPPVFSGPTRFPSLGKLGRLRPPSATILRFSADILFDFDKSTLKPEAIETVSKVAAVLAKMDKPIQVDGHTDAKGSDEYNDKLSLDRAESFAKALKEHGVNVTMTTKGWGEKHPVAPNTTADGKDNPSGRAQNRRVEVILKN